MAKRLLLNVLLSVLGDYVEGLSENNLKLGVWSGEIHLSNLQINRTILQRLNLPVVIHHGSVKALNIKIPWASLESNPLKINIDGIYLQVGPLDLSQMEAEELTVRALEMKIFRLKEIDKAIERAAQSESNVEETLSYWQRLTATIVDNIEISLRNVHIRYEDSMTIPGNCFAFGITLDTFDVNTRDKDWKEGFIKKGNSKTGINKLAKIKNFGIYWNPKSRPLAQLPFASWVRAMQGCIYTEQMQMNIVDFSSRDVNSPMEYILLPTNSLIVKIVHFEHAPENTPRLDVLVEITHLQLTLDKLQFIQLTETLRLLSMLEKQQQLLSHRPKFRPNKDPRSWWFYAVKLVRKNEEMFSGI